MSTSNIRAGGAYVEMGTKDNLSPGLKRAEIKLKAFRAAADSIGNRALLIGAPVLGAFALATSRAGDFAESISKFETVFGAQSNSVKGWGDEFANQVGRSRKQITDFLAGSKDLFTPLGFDEAEAVDMSKAITGLAVDLASFNNTADDAALRDLHAALTGSGEVMKKYGIVLSEATTKQELFNMGLDPSNATEAQKAQARYNIIVAGSAAAIGDAVKTAGSLNNQKKRLKANVDDLSVSIGSMLLPVVTEMVSDVADGVKGFERFTKENTSLTVGTAYLAAGLVSTGVALKGVAIGCNAATVAMRGTAAAAALLKANPIFLAAAAITAAGVGTFMALEQINAITLATSDSMTKFREKSDQMRSGDLLRIARLRQLIDIQSRTKEQNEEAAKLIKELSGRYGEFGVEIDQITNKLKVQTDWQRKLNDEMRKKTRGNIRGEIQQLQDKISSRNTAGRDKASSWWKPVAGWNDGLNPLGSFSWARIYDSDNNQISEWGKQNLADMEKIYQLRQRLKSLDAGDENALTGSAQANSPGKSNSPLVQIAELNNAQTRLAAINKDLARERRSQLENEIEDIKELAAEQKKLVEIVLNGELSRKNVDQAKVAELRKQLQSVTPTMNERINRAKAASVKAMDDSVRSSVRDIQKREADHQTNAYFDELTGRDPAKAVQELETHVKNAGKNFEDLARELDAVVTKAKADGIISQSEQSNLDTLKEHLSAAYGTFSEHRGRLQQAYDAAAERMRGDVVGSFHFDARAFGSELSSPMERIAKISAEQLNVGKETNRILRKLDPGVVTIV